MIPEFEANPGRIYVVATLLPLAAFALLLVGGGVRCVCRPFRREGGLAGSLYWIFGGDKPLKTGACLATACMAFTAILAVNGLVLFLSESSDGSSPHWAERTDWVRIGPPDAATPSEWERQHRADPSRPPLKLAMALEIGYRIDALTAVVFAMVSVIATLIFIFSIGYMKDETEEKVEDHEVDLQRGETPTLLPHAGDTLDPHEPDAPAFSPPHPHSFSRRGRFGRFFLYLSLFCFSMLNLVIADNLFQVFASWELVGVCSFFLIGFYYERPSAARAANKAFIVNRIGDAGFLVGILLAWTYLGTLNFEEMFHRLRVPASNAFSTLQVPHQLYRAEQAASDIVVIQSRNRFQRSEISETVVAETRKIPGVEAVSAMIAEAVEIDEQAGNILIEGRSPGDFAFEGETILSGRRLEAGDRDKVMLGAEAAKYRDKKVGDRITLRNHGAGIQCEVVGIYKSPIYEANEIAILPLNDAQRLTGILGRVNAFEVRLSPSASVTAVCERIETLRDPRYPAVQLTTLSSQNNTPFSISEKGSYLALYPVTKREQWIWSVGSWLPFKYWFTAPGRGTIASFGAIPYWLFVVMGIGIFLGCVGKSAQVPLHTWLPDAMEGPTPVSALIHAATMVAAGVYLVGRCFPLFAPEVLLVIAYTGAVTLFIAATIALVQTDIKRILAYSTCSQLGFMMLALGVGGWVAGLMHLITHAFFKALLFLCSGSVILGCHHEQDVRKMGGLRRKMPITALTMLVGVLAICGMPLFSGWYSKDQVIAVAMGFGIAHPAHFLLLVLPVVTAGMTAFYMFRLWFLTFAGKPREEHIHEHARESPLVMTVPLIVLAVFSVGVAWGWPVWDADASALRQVLEKAEPAVLTQAVKLQQMFDNPEHHLPVVEVAFAHERETTHQHHITAEVVALVMALLGVAVAYLYFGRAQPTRESLYATGNAGYRFLLGKWYFDEAYDAVIVNPTVGLAKTAAAVDKRPTDAPPPPGETELPAKRFDFRTLDGILNAFGQLATTTGLSLRVVQTGQLRTYVLALALTAVVLLAILVSL